MFRSRRSAKTVAILIIALVMASVTYAFAAGNTFPDGVPSAGDGETTVSGYVITNVAFSHNATDRTKVDSVSFSISPEPVTVQVKVDNTANWYDCTEGATTTCTFTTPLDVAAIDRLRVLATSY